MRAEWLVTFAAAALIASPVFGQIGDLSLTLNPDSGAGYVPNALPEPDPPCLSVDGCVLFTGTLLDTDSDDSFISLSDPLTGLADITLTLSVSPANGGLTLDNTFDDLVPATLVGDTNGLADFGVPNEYSGPIFGIDIAPGTTPGEYTGTVTFEGNGGDGDPDNQGFTVSQQVTVDLVAPEPATWGLAMAGLAALGACSGLRRKRTGLTTSEEARSALSRIRRANRLRLWSVRCARDEKWRSSEASR